MPKRNSVLSKSGLTSSRLRDLLSYDSESGVFRWAKSFGNAKEGKQAGCVGPHGYRYIGVDAGFFKAHQLAWLYVTGEYPVAEIDHIDGNRDNNAFCNLRRATRSENMQNKKKYANATSAYQGVHFHKCSGKWCAAIQVDRARKHLGVFDTPELASAAYLAAKLELHRFQPTPRGVV